MQAIVARITRQDVRKAVKETKAPKGELDFCQTCLVSQIVKRVTKKRYVETSYCSFSIGVSKSKRKTHYFTDKVKPIMLYFDRGYDRATNVDAFYKELKLSFPGLIQFTN